MKRILLIGAGHAHAVVLRALAKNPLHGARITLVSPLATQLYSAMLPGLIAGHYARREAELDIARLDSRIRDWGFALKHAARVVTNRGRGD